MTSSPGEVSVRGTTWLAIVPVGNQSAASLPSSPATRSWRRLTVGSSPNWSSPTSASAIAARILDRPPGDGVGTEIDRCHRASRPDGAHTRVGARLGGRPRPASAAARTEVPGRRPSRVDDRQLVDRVDRQADQPAHPYGQEPRLRSSVARGRTVSWVSAEVNCFASPSRECFSMSIVGPRPHRSQITPDNPRERYARPVCLRNPGLVSGSCLGRSARWLGIIFVASRPSPSLLSILAQPFG